MADRYDAVVFDLLTGLLDSWTLWAEVAGDPETGRRWREHYLAVTYDTGDYVPYEDLVAQAADDLGLGTGAADRLVARWDELRPWPEVPDVLATLATSTRLAVVTNCSVALGRRAVARVGADLDAVVIAEEVGAYKPRPEPYLAALEQLALPADRVLFVAGSKYDVDGAGAVGLDVWWHNRAGLALADAEHRPVAEHGSLDPLPEFVAAR